MSWPSSTRRLIQQESFHRNYRFHGAPRSVITRLRQDPQKSPKFCGVVAASPTPRTSTSSSSFAKRQVGAADASSASRRSIPTWTRATGRMDGWSPRRRPEDGARRVDALLGRSEGPGHAAEPLLVEARIELEASGDASRRSLVERALDGARTAARPRPSRPPRTPCRWACSRAARERLAGPLRESGSLISGRYR